MIKTNDTMTYSPKGKPQACNDERP